MIYIYSGNYKLHNGLFIFLCSILIDHVAAQEKNDSSESYSRESLKFKTGPEWIFAPVGESAILFLQLFYAYVNSGPVRFVIYEKISDFKTIVETVFAYIFRDQHTMANISIIGILGILILLFMPYWIMLYRNDQIKNMEETLLHGSLVSPRQGVLIADFLYPFLIISIFGGILMCFAVVEVRNNLPKGFEFAVSTVNTSYMYKEIILDKYYYNIFDISQSVFETIQLMHEINDEVHRKFIKEVNLHLDPIIDLTSSVLLDVEYLTKSLARMKKELEFFTKNSSQNIKNLTDEYFVSLTNLKKVFDKENASDIFELTLDPLFEITNYSSNVTFENFDDVIIILQTVLELKLEDKIQNITHYFRDAVDNVTYNASEIIEDLKRIAFSTEEKTRDIVGFYIPYIKKYFTETLKNRIVDGIMSIRISVLNAFETIYIVIFIFSIVSIFFGTIFATFFSLGIVGTKGFRIEFPGLRGYKSSLSDKSGKIIVFFLYISAFFLASFWALSIILFVFSTIPLETCFSAKDKSLFNFEFDFLTPNKTLDYAGYRMGVFPIVLQKHITECEKDSSYSRFLPEFPLNQSEIYHVKEKVNSENVSNEVQIAFKNIPSINLSEILDLDFQEIKNLDINSDLQNIESFTEEFNKKNTSSILRSISNHNRSSNVLRKAAQTALKSFDALTTELSKSSYVENYSNSTLRSLNVTTTTIVIEIDHLKLTIEVLNEILKENISDLYISTFNETINDLIDVFAFTLDSSVYSFRKSISFCSDLFLFYRNCIFITCKLILNPIASAWMGSFFVAIFLLFSVVLCLYAVPLFLIPARKVFIPPPPVINIRDFPSTPRNRMGPWAQVHPSEESVSTSSNSDAISATTDVDLSFKKMSVNSMEDKKIKSRPDVLETCSIETNSDIKEEDRQDKTTNSVDIENSANIKEIKLLKVLTRERRNENITSDSESSKDEYSSSATSTDTGLVPRSSVDKTTSSVDKENITDS